jgi:hypothetical protein
LFQGSVQPGFHSVDRLVKMHRQLIPGPTIQVRKTNHVLAIFLKLVNAMVQVLYRLLI